VIKNTVTVPKRKRWQDTRAFVRALKARGYLAENNRPVMSDGIYLYLFELWIDGVVMGWRQGRQALRRKHVTEHDKAARSSQGRKGRGRHNAA